MLLHEHCVLDLSYKDVFVIKSFWISNFCFSLPDSVVTLLNETKPTLVLKKIDLVSTTTGIYIFPIIVFHLFYVQHAFHLRF